VSPDVARFSLLPCGRDRAARFWPLAEREADRLALRYPGLAEEMRSAVVYALLEAAGHFDERLGGNFATFVIYQVRRRVRNVFRDSRAARRNPRRLAGYPVPPELPAAPERRDGLPELLLALDPRHAAFVRLVVEGGLSRDAAAAASGFPAVQADRRWKKVMARLGRTRAAREAVA
jgi:DNA-directed RNA polymerase specialized sigma24 family protein